MTHIYNNKKKIYYQYLHNNNVIYLKNLSFCKPNSTLDGLHRFRRAINTWIVFKPQQAKDDLPICWFFYVPNKKSNVLSTK